jgi:hypothetical protein
MPTNEECFEHAPKLAQKIENYSGPLQDPLKEDFAVLLSAAIKYRMVKMKMDEYRKHESWDEKEGADEETSARKLFCEAYNIFLEKHPKAEAWFPRR